MSEKTSRTKHTFHQLSRFVKPYRGVFVAVALFAILSSIFSTAQPYLIKVAIDDFITPKNYEGLLHITYILIALLCADRHTRCARKTLRPLVAPENAIF